VTQYGIVYGLYDPRTEKLRYVGQTTYALSRRVANHVSKHGLSKTTHVACWLRALSRAGLRPYARTLYVALDRAALDAAEEHMIALFKSLGERLTNHARGGRGNAGVVRSDVTRQRLSKAARESSAAAAHRKVLADARRGTRRPAAWVAKTAAKNKGKHHTDATKRKIAEARTNKRVDNTVIDEMVGAGMTTAAIARYFAVSETCIYKRLRRRSRQ
jgi:hypothetical protein